MPRSSLFLSCAFALAAGCSTSARLNAMYAAPEEATVVEQPDDEANAGGAAEVRDLSRAQALSVIDALRTNDTAEFERGMARLEDVRLPADVDVTGRLLSIATRPTVPESSMRLFRLVSDALDRVIETDAENWQAWMQRGVARFGIAVSGEPYEELQRLESAVEALRKAVALSGNRPGPTYWLAQGLMRLGARSFSAGSDEEAEAWYRENYHLMSKTFKEDAPDHMRSQTAEAAVRYADACWRLGRYEEALGIYDRAREQIDAIEKRGPHWCAAAGLLAISHTTVAEWAVCEPDIEKAITHDRTALELGREVARHDKRGRYADLIDWAALTGLAHAHIFKGEYATALGHLDGAAAVMRRGTGENLEWAPFSRSRGLTCLEKMRDAIAHLRDAAPDDHAAPALALRVLGDTAHVIQQSAESRLYFARALELRTKASARGDRESRKWVVFARADCFAATRTFETLDDARGHARAGIALAEELLKEDPSDFELENQLGDLLSSMARVEKDHGDAAVSKQYALRAAAVLESLNTRGKLFPPLVASLKRLREQQRERTGLLETERPIRAYTGGEDRPGVEARIIEHADGSKSLDVDSGGVRLRMTSPADR